MRHTFPSINEGAAAGHARMGGTEEHDSHPGE